MSTPLGQPVGLTLGPTTDRTGRLVTPTGGTVTILRPDGVTDTILFNQLTLDSPGLLHYDYTPPATGLYAGKYVTTGPVSVTEFGFAVDPPRPAGADLTLVTLAEVRAHLNYDDPAFTADDAELMRFAVAASEVAEEFGGIVQQRPVVETHDGGRPTVVLLEPCVSVTSVVEYLGSTAYTLTQEPFGGSGYSNYGFTVEGQVLTRRNQGFLRPFMGGKRNVVVTYVAGQAYLPQRVKHGVLELIRDWWEASQQVTTGTLGGSYANSDEAGPASLSDRGYAVPAAIEQMLTPEPRISGLA